MQNFVQQGESRGWLFLNVDPYVAIEGPRYGSFFAHMLHENGFAPHRVAVELIESQVMSEASLAAAVEYYREMGCVIVIDDFGAGYSNFDRIWRLRPNIVKIDREMTRRIGAEARVRYMFSGIVSVLHQAGALVCVEGIETEHEALCALDAGADLVQGRLFAPPAPQLVEEQACRSCSRPVRAVRRGERRIPRAPPHQPAGIFLSRWSAPPTACRAARCTTSPARCSRCCSAARSAAT